MRLLAMVVGLLCLSQARGFMCRGILSGARFSRRAFLRRPVGRGGSDRPIDVFSLTEEELTSELQALGQPKFRAKQIRKCEWLA